MNFSSTAWRSAQSAREPPRKVRMPDFISLVRSWGGVSLVYRKRLQDSPAYRLNHEEVQKALEEGINFVECMNPNEAVPDEYNAVKAIVFEKLDYVAESGKFDTQARCTSFLPAPYAWLPELHRTLFTKRKSREPSSWMSGGSFSPVQGRAKQ